MSYSILNFDSGVYVSFKILWNEVVLEFCKEKLISKLPGQKCFIEQSLICQGPPYFYGLYHKTYIVIAKL